MWLDYGALEKPNLVNNAHFFAVWTAPPGSQKRRTRIGASVRRMVTPGEHYVFQLLTAITTVVQHSFGKLLRLFPTPIIIALWLLDSPSGCGWADVVVLCPRCDRCS